MDTAARRLGIDPLELRRRNVIRAEDLPYTTARHVCYDAITPAETLEQAASMIGYDGFRAEQAGARAEGRYLGIGLGLYVEPSAIAIGDYGSEAAMVRIGLSGKVPCALGSAARAERGDDDRAGRRRPPRRRVDDVTVVQGDTAVAPYGAGTGGQPQRGDAAAAPSRRPPPKCGRRCSRSPHMPGGGARGPRDRRRRVSVRGTPTKGMVSPRWRRLAYLGHDLLPPGMETGLEASHRYKAPPFTWSNACHVCTVRGRRRHGPGDAPALRRQRGLRRMINPNVVEGQIAGGVVQGIGGVLYEHMRLRRRRQPADHDVRRLPAADRGRGADHRVRPHRDARRKPGGRQGHGRGRRDRRRRRRHQRRRRRGRPPRRQGLWLAIGPQADP